MQYVYTVTINVPEDDEYDYHVQIGQNGMAVGIFKGPMIPAMEQIGDMIMDHIEANQ